MTTLSVYQQNQAKLKELQPDKQWAAFQWVDECDRLNLKFRITEVYRTKERQYQLYQIGRRGIKGESPVTFTLDSQHVKRLAVDVLPINCTYKDIEQVAERYGITHPFTKGLFIDQPHFEFASVVSKPLNPTTPIPLVLSQDAEKKRFTNGIKRIKEVKARQRAIERYIKQFGELPNI